MEEGDTIGLEQAARGSDRTLNRGRRTAHAVNPEIWFSGASPPSYLARSMRWAHLFENHDYGCLQDSLTSFPPLLFYCVLSDNQRTISVFVLESRVNLDVLDFASLSIRVSIHTRKYIREELPLTADRDPNTAPTARQTRGEQC